MQVKVISTGFELKDGVFHFKLDGEVLGDTTAQHDLLDFAFANGKVFADTNVEDFDHPHFSVSLFVSEEDYKKELKRREDEKSGKLPAEAPAEAPAPAAASEKPADSGQSQPSADPSQA
jgi:hypothetical protein